VPTPVARTSAVPDLVNKAVAAIHIKNDISCLQRKLWNVLLSNAYSELPSPSVQTHQIRVRDLMEEVGFDSKNIAYLKQALEDMVTTKLTWNILDEKGKQEWGVSAALASAVIADGICSYSYSAHLRPKLYHPEFYARIPLGVVRRFRSGHALALYENGKRFLFISETPWISLPDFRDLLGVGGNTSYDDFKTFNRAVIKPSLQEVNTVSDIQMELELKREKRKVVGVKFLINGNQQDSLPIEDTIDFNPSLLASLQETFCLSEKQAKEILVTNSDERIQAVMDYVGERYKAGKIREGKIAPYFLRTLKDFDHSNTVSSIDREKRQEKERRESMAKREARVKDLREKFSCERTAQVEAYWKGLPHDQRESVTDSFSAHLQQHNQVVLTFYRKSGLKTKVVYTEFMNFLGSRILPAFEAAFESYLKENEAYDEA
jgi:hypothetical protein